VYGIEQLGKGVDIGQPFTTSIIPQDRVWGHQQYDPQIIGYRMLGNGKIQIRVGRFAQTNFLIQSEKKHNEILFALFSDAHV
jgi:hypothetical protein